MLAISKIRSELAYEEQWRKHRIGKITASPFGKLIGDRSHLGVFSKGAITYLESVAWERITGKPIKEDFHSSDTDFGNAHEAEAIVFFCQQTGLRVLLNTRENDMNETVVANDGHKLIDDDEWCCVTPDGLIALTDEANLFDSTGQYIKIADLEVKCPPSRFLKFYQCRTPEDLKKADKTYYWQKILQALVCDSLLSYWGAYKPKTYNQETGEEEPPMMRIIEFKKVELIEDFKKAAATLHHAKQRVQELIKVYNN